MAWPSSTKAGTTNVDAGSDSPSSARADIKQNIDNVNAIIDEFDIASPSNGDILTYNSTSGAWEPGASSAGSSVAVIEIEPRLTGEENVSSNIYRRYLSESVDSGGMVSLSGNYQFTLGAGTYFIEPTIYVDPESGGQSEVFIELYNESDSTSEHNFLWNEIGTTADHLLTGYYVLTIASSKNFSFRQDTVTPSSRASTPSFKITK